MKPETTMKEQIFIEEAKAAFTSYLDTNPSLAEKIGTLDGSNSTVNIVKLLARDTYNSGFKISAVIEALDKFAANTINEVTPQVTNYDELKNQIFFPFKTLPTLKAPLSPGFENAKKILIDFFASHEAYAQQIRDIAKTHYINFAKSFAQDHSHLSSEDLIKQVSNIQVVEAWLKDKNPIPQLAQDTQPRERSNSQPGRKP